MTNLEKYYAVFLEIFQISKEDLDDGFSNKNSEVWDSMTHLEMITELEDQFGIMFDPEDIMEFDSFEKGKELLRKYDIEL